MKRFGGLESLLADDFRFLGQPFRGGVKFLDVGTVLLKKSLKTGNVVEVTGDGIQFRVVQGLRKPIVVAGIATPFRFELFVLAAQIIKDELFFLARTSSGRDRDASALPYSFASRSRVSMIRWTNCLSRPIAASYFPSSSISPPAP